MTKKCPRCKGDLELHTMATEKPGVWGQAYYCSKCKNIFSKKEI